MTRRAVQVAVLTVALLLTVAGCSDDDADEATTTTTTTAADDETTGGTAEGPGEPNAEVVASVQLGTATTEYGEVLTEPGGKTLYAFDADAGGEPTCVDDA